MPGQNKGFISNLDEYFKRYSVDKKVNSMVYKDPKFGESIKRMKQRRKDLEDLMNKIYDEDKDN